MSIISSTIKYLFAGKIINSCHVDYTLCGIFSSRLIRAHHGGWFLERAYFQTKPTVLSPSTNAHGMQADHSVCSWQKMYWQPPQGTDCHIIKYRVKLSFVYEQWKLILSHFIVYMICTHLKQYLELSAHVYFSIKKISKIRTSVNNLEGEDNP